MPLATRWVTNPGDSPPAPSHLTLITPDRMADILRNPDLFPMAVQDKLGFPKSLCDTAKPRAIILPVPDMNLYEIAERFSDQTRKPTVRLSDRLEWEKLRIERTPPSWLRFEPGLRPFDENVFTERGERRLAEEGKRVANARELVILYVTLREMKHDMAKDLLTLLSGSKTEVRGEYVAVVMPGLNMPDSEIRMYPCVRTNLRHFRHIIVTEG